MFWDILLSISFRCVYHVSVVIVELECGYQGHATAHGNWSVSSWKGKYDEIQNHWHQQGLKRYTDRAYTLTDAFYLKDKAGDQYFAYRQQIQSKDQNQQDVSQYSLTFRSCLRHSVPSTYWRHKSLNGPNVYTFILKTLWVTDLFK